MTDASATQTTFNPRRALLGAAIALVAHGLSIAAGFIAGQVVEPSAGGGFEDLAAVVVTFLLGQAVLAVGSVIASIILTRRGRQDVAVGLIIAWALGLVGVLVFAMA